MESVRQIDIREIGDGRSNTMRDRRHPDRRQITRKGQKSMNRRERWIMTASLTVGMLLSLVLITAGVVDFGGALAQDSAQDNRPIALQQNTDRPDAVKQESQGTLPSATDVINQVSPAVVTVINEQRVRTMDGTSSIQPVGSGTGFIIDDQGHIVTNWHVVDGGSQFQVVFKDGTRVDATLIGSDSVSDLAVVKIDGEVPGVLAFGDSDALQAGEPVLAIGSPLGDFQNTVTQGIVSAINRDFPGGGQSQYNNLVQHDAAINPGNSGGPLINFNGEVVGVNTLGISIDQQGQPIQGLFFAIPSNSVKQVADELIASGEVTYPYVGISYQSNSPTAAAQLELSTDTGVVVIEVPRGGPAAEAGVQPGDVITKVGEFTLDSQTTFSEALFNYAPGDDIDLTIQRGDEELTVTVTLGNRATELDQ
jgi:2-alkenal reductase